MCLQGALQQFFMAEKYSKYGYSKTCLKRPLKKNTENWISKPITA